MTAKKAKEKGEGEAYVVFARRFRPQAFEDVVGQSTVTAALRHALKSGRLAQAYLLAGPRGVGKTSLARIFAKALNCQKGKGPGGLAVEPCNECDACLSIQEGRALDVIEMDAATNRGINEIRELRDNVGLAPSELRFKIYIVDEVHMLTNEAWNAFLKTLEEPPVHVKFVFATTDPDRIPETILSRCQRFDLRRIGLPEIVQRLRQICDAEKVKAAPAALERIAALSKGGLRDAESMLDLAVNLGEGSVDDEVVRQIAGAAPDELVFGLLQACAEGRVADALGEASKALDAGADPDDLLVEIAERLRGTLLARTCGAESPLLAGQSHLKDSYAKLAGLLSEDQFLMLLQLFGNARRQVKDAAQARLPLEMAIVRAARAKDLVDLGKLVEALETGTGAGPAASGARPPAVREGPRPNAPGRPAGTSVRPAAMPQASGSGASVPAVASAPRAGLPERWDEVLAAVRPVPGGSIIASALSHLEVRLETEGGRLQLGFGAAQSFYSETLERPERLYALKVALEQVYGKAFEIAFERLQGVRPVFTLPLPPPPRAVGQVPAVPERAAEESPAAAQVAEEDFDDEGALPLPHTAASAPEPEVEIDVDADEPDDVGPAAVQAPVVHEQVFERATEEEREAAKEHPLVKALLEKVGGEVMDVRKLRAARKG
ncbi:MAG: DNA polymerase III subunit gamma/tau [Planctomycetes bacterium]|nr:DNA polymerase III subunit gamma/tau [Planctomycetota bacterium]